MSIQWVIALIAVALIALIAIRIQPEMSWQVVYDAERTWPRASKAVVSWIDRTTPGDMQYTTDRFAVSLEGAGTQTLFVVTDHFRPDSASLGILCRSVREGVTLCVSAERYARDVLDSFRVNTIFVSADDFWLVDRDHQGTYQASTELLSNRALLIKSYDGWEPIFINNNGVYAAARPFGRGRIVMTTMPLLFTNYALLYQRHGNVLSDLLGYLPSGPVIWDQHYKPAGSRREPMLGVLQRYPGLELAYWVLLAMGVGAVVVNAKRRQRAIPVAKSTPDSSIDFVDHIAMIYWNRRDHRTVVNQQLRQFRMQLVRRHRCLPAQITASEADHIATITNCDVAVITRLLELVDTIDGRRTITAAELRTIHNDLEHFYSQSPL